MSYTRDRIRADMVTGRTAKADTLTITAADDQEAQQSLRQLLDDYHGMG